MSDARCHRRREGFTLVELLVVIAVIAILAALLLPALHRAKLATETAACKSNLRQLGLGLAMYVQQHGSYPIYTNLAAELQPFTAASWPEDNYSNGITMYLGPRQSIWACPAYNAVRGRFYIYQGYQGNALGSYGYHSAGFPPFLRGLSSVMGDPRQEVPTRESEVLKPCDMIAFGDAVLWPGQSPIFGVSDLSFGLWNNDWYNEVMLGLPLSDPAVQAVKRRHDGRWNIGFCDGHVENIAPNRLFDTNNPAMARRWNRDNQP